MTNQENRALGPSQDHYYRLIACVASTHTHTHTHPAVHVSNTKERGGSGEEKSECPGLNPWMSVAEQDADLRAVMDPPLPPCSPL